MVIMSIVTLFYYNFDIVVEIAYYYPTAEPEGLSSWVTYHGGLGTSNIHVCTTLVEYILSF